MAIKSIFGVKEIYLGSSLLMNRNKSKDFKVLKDRVNLRLEGWNRNLLSKAGKDSLIFLVIQAILVYSMSTLQIPTSISNDLDTAVRYF